MEPTSLPNARAQLAEALEQVLPLDGRNIMLERERRQRLERPIDRLIVERIRLLLEGTQNSFEAYENLRAEHTQEALESGSR